MIRPVEPQSGGGPEVCLSSLKSVSMFQALTFLLFQFRGQSEAATKTLSDWAEGDLVWFKVFSLPSESF